MATPFSRTTRSLQADGFRGAGFGLALAACLLGGWVVWFLLARVARYEVTDTARLEVDRAVHRVDAPVAGRVVATHLVLSQEVQAGDVLVELDARGQRLQLAEDRSRLTALGPQLDAIRQEVAAEERALEESRGAARVALDEARAQQREAEAVAALAEQEAARADQLRAGGILSEVEQLRARASAKSRRAAAESLKLAVERQAGEQQARETDRQAHIENLRRDVTRLEGEKITAAATVERLEHEGEMRHVVAPVAGRIGEVATLQIGSVVAEGDKLATIVPAGKLRVLAHYHPAQALGRILPGQPARLRLEGFPWMQYGSIATTVASVASEAREGRVRVELSVTHDSVPSPMLQHGLPGSLEVEVERVSPATLVLRAAGQLLSRPVAALDAGRAGETSP
jgi:membrane fusion protein (multidrug efflux system)